MDKTCIPAGHNHHDVLQRRSHELLGLTNRALLSDNKSATTALLPLALPEPGLQLEQDAEWFLVRLGRTWQQLRFHDYATIYGIPGLYERLFYDILKCDSPTVLRRALIRQLDRARMAARGLRILDLGAGNGMVAEQLAELDVELMIGADILEEAAQAAQRDRPNVYDSYLVLDFAQLSNSQHKQLLQLRLNCLTCVAALGFGDIPAAAFANAFNAIDNAGWIAFTIKEEFVHDQSRSEFAQLIEALVRSGSLEILTCERYRHRFSIGGVPLHYKCFVGRKRKSFEYASFSL